MRRGRGGVRWAPRAAASGDSLPKIAMLIGTTVNATGIVQARKIPVPGKIGASTATRTILAIPTPTPISGTQVALPSVVSTTSWRVKTDHRTTESRNHPAVPIPCRLP